MLGPGAPYATLYCQLLALETGWLKIIWAGLHTKTASVPFISAQFTLSYIAATFFDAWRLILLLFKSDMSDYAGLVIVQCLKNKTQKSREDKWLESWQKYKWNKRNTQERRGLK